METGGSLPAATYALSSAGTQTAALVFGGANSSDTKQSTTYTYDGTSFSATPNSLNTAREINYLVEESNIRTSSWWKSIFC